MNYVWYYETPIGRLGVAGTDTAVSHVLFAGSESLPGCELSETAVINRAAAELLEYFDGKRTGFDFPLLLQGTVFQNQVWEALQTIPFGETRSYKDIAGQIGRPKAMRAVGMANHCNPLPIVIPCHRVVGASGRLVGYAGGLAVKQFLLDLEKRHA